MKMSEEINRILTDRISDLLCCPTENAMKNLAAEGFSNFGCIFLNTGDVMQDAALYYSAKLAGRKTIVTERNAKDFILCTLHRAENTNDPRRLSSIVDALNTIHQKIPVVLPLHPRTKKTVEALGLTLRVDVVPPMGYFDMLALLSSCRMVLTDSGGLQKEAYFFKKPCVTLRDETEWAELLEIGCNLLAGADKPAILNAVDKMLAQKLDFSTELFGGGKAASQIIGAIEKHLCG
jgi:UDP-GlcNAc3NAcA epimerase